MTISSEWTMCHVGARHAVPLQNTGTMPNHYAVPLQNPETMPNHNAVTRQNTQTHPATSARGLAPKPTDAHTEGSL
jgi:hypothetical protein